MSTIPVQDFAGTGALDGNWTVDEGTVARVSDVAETGTGGSFNRARYTGTQFETLNQYVIATIGGKGTENCGTIILRQDDSSHYFYELSYIFENNASGFRIRRVENASESDLTTASSSGITGAQRFKFTAEVSGSDVLLTAYRWVASDWSQIMQVTSSSGVYTGLFTGMKAWANGARFDDWEAGDIVAVAAPNMHVVRSALRFN